MEVSWSPSHNRMIHEPLLSPSHHNLQDVNFEHIRRSLSRSPSRLHLSQFHARLSRRNTPSATRLHSATSPSEGRWDDSKKDSDRLSPQNVRQALVRSTPIRQPQFGFCSNENEPPTSAGLARSSSDTYGSQQLVFRSTPAHPSPSKTPARSSVRRALSIASDNGNSTTPRSSPSDGEGQENEQSSNPLFDSTPKIYESPSKSESPRLNTPKFKPREKEWRPVKSSPLKRSDAVMNLNHATSPAVKRRTFCAGIKSSSFELFRDNRDDSVDTTDSETEMATNDVLTRPTLTSSSFYGRHTTSFGSQSQTASRPRRSFERSSESPRKSKSGLRQRLRLPSTASSATSGASDVMRLPLGPQSLSVGEDLSSKPHKPPPLRVSFPHPLSKALSPTSPTPPASFGRGIKSGFEDRFASEESATKLDFSKSLPLGALRQPLESRQTSLASSQQSSTESIETPRRYQMARPDPAAFRSTGLISKKHRNPEDMPPPPAGQRRMPDTPCKRGLNGFTFGESPTPNHNAFVEPPLRQSSFDTPSKTVLIPATGGPLTSSKPASTIFGTSVTFGSLNRCASFASLIDEDQSQSGVQQDSQSSNDELPPTPTKQVSNTKSGSLRSSLFGRHPPLSGNLFQPPAATPQINLATTNVSQDSPCKYISSIPAPGLGSSLVERLDDTIQCFTTVGDSSPLSPLSFAQVRLERQSTRTYASSSLRNKTHRPNASSSLRWKPAKPIRPTPVFRSSIPISLAHVVPRTPVDNGVPDPSSLSISPNDKNTASPVGTNGLWHNGSFTPATPTHRDVHTIPETPRAPAITPSHHQLPEDFDAVLTKRFTKVEKWASGEFSNVYKVHDASRTLLFETKRADDVYAIKKSRLPYHSAKMRENQLREAQIMGALSKSETEGSDHVVRMINSWEASGHLYIQTEFCSDGNLEQFLDRIGNKDRLDDFRIWKILREICLGLLHIHDSGYIHLDLKPANVLLAFNGALKIADFGLACRWPAPANTEGEGDRRYIAPELLQGRIDKPADVFALGLIIFEIASNKVLPNNGKSWQKLRSGDWSDLEKSDEKSLTTLPSLTSGSTNSLSRDSQSSSRNMDYTSHGSLYPYKDVSMPDMGSSRPSFDIEEAAGPPHFVLDSHDPQSLDSIVHWMMHPDPDQRPTVHQILDTAGCQWVNLRSRAAGATIDEGPWGPSPHLLKEQLDMDAEMLDV